MSLILWFDEVGIKDVPLVGGKNASLGEMFQRLKPVGVNVPDGFAITAEAYRYFIKEARLIDKLKETLTGLDTHNIEDLKRRGNKIRTLIRNAVLPKDLASGIIENYKKLCAQYGMEAVDVAVRSSATAEDLPDASFAGQQETYLNIRGEENLLYACRKCFASLFTNRAISYREDKGFEHLDVYLSIAIQKMVRSDAACAGVIFTLDTESGFRDVVFNTCSYGLGENVVKGAVNPDEYYVFKPTLKMERRPIIGKTIGSKEQKMIYSGDGRMVKNVPTTREERDRYVLNDDEILLLAKWACEIEEHYGKPMDIEWAKDGDGKDVGTGQFFIVQARPETVHSIKDYSTMETYVLREKYYELEERGKVLCKGLAVGTKIAKGKANIIKSASQITKFMPGEVLITDMTDPDWEPIMKVASAIVTNRGGRTCFMGDTKVLTNQGFLRLDQIYRKIKLKESLFTPALNKETMKLEWKKITDSMRRKAPIIEVSISQTGRSKENILKITPDHKMITFHNRKLIDKEIFDITKDKEMILVANNLPPLSMTYKNREMAYLIGALSTDGCITFSNGKGCTVFTQKETPSKKAFINEVRTCFSNICGRELVPRKKNPFSGVIRGSIVSGTATDFRCFNTQVAIQLLELEKNFPQQVLILDQESLLRYLAAVVDGDGCYNSEANRINIYCEHEEIVQNIVIACLRLGMLPQVTNNRNCYNVQIVEKVNNILKFTKRVKGTYKRKVQGTRLFAARQILLDIINSTNWKGRIRPYVNKNLLLDKEKIKERIMPLVKGEVRRQLNLILDSDLQMQRVKFNTILGIKEVYNLEVEDHHNYLVFTSRYTPVLVNNCHAAIVSRELGIPCVIGTETATRSIKNGQEVTVDCSEGEIGYIYDGFLEYDIERLDLEKLPETKTKVMMNVGIPEKAFSQGQLPCDGVGLAREEFIINSHIGIHPLALIYFDELKNKAKDDKKFAKIVKKIEERTKGYANKVEYFVERLAMGIGRIGAAFYPRDVIVRLSDFKTNEYANLIGGELYEPQEHNPMIGWRGASRYYDKEFKPAFGLECKALLKARNEMGLTNIKVMVPFCRTPKEGKKVIEIMKEYGLVQGENDLEVYVMCEIPSNVILADEFCDVFDGFSIGSNDLTQLALGLDRDSELVAHLYDERSEAVKRLVSRVIEIARQRGKKIGICGQAPSDFPEFTEFLVKCGIDSISLNPDVVIKTRLLVAEKERELGIK